MIIFEINTIGRTALSIPNAPIYRISVSTNDYKSEIDEALGYLIVYLADKSSNTNK